MTAAVTTKRCMKCQKDLTGVKRLKDSKGQYWCPDCGVGGNAASHSGLVSPCPKCHSPVHAAHLIRDPKSGAYVCESCAAGVKGKTKNGAAAPSAEDAAKRTKVILGCLMIVGGGVAYYVLNYVLA
jgi:hypothetical protein